MLFLPAPDPIQRTNSQWVNHRWCAGSEPGTVHEAFPAVNGLWVRSHTPVCSLFLFRVARVGETISFTSENLLGSQSQLTGGQQRGAGRSSCAQQVANQKSHWLVLSTEAYEQLPRNAGSSSHCESPHECETPHPNRRAAVDASPQVAVEGNTRYMLFLPAPDPIQCTNSQWVNHRWCAGSEHLEPFTRPSRRRPPPLPSEWTVTLHSVVFLNVVLSCRPRLLRKRTQRCPQSFP